MVHKIYTKWMGSWLLACSWRRLNLDVWYGFRPPARRGYGFPVGRLYVGWKTLLDSMGEKSLQYVNAIGPDEEHQENRDFHSGLLLGQLRALFETDIYHTSFPWRAILALDSKRWNDLLHDMKTTWEFVQDVCDKLREKEPLARLLTFTQFQPFRDCMVKAEFFDFQLDAMHTAASAPFKSAANSIAGITGEHGDCLQSSLPSELAFNDLRDAARRHSRKETTAGHNLHCVAAKSAQKRNMKCASVSLSDSDWSVPVDQKVIKASVFSAIRQTDVSLGISSEGLTRHRKSLYTKPHTFCERLDLFQSLRKVHAACSGDSDDKRMACLKAFRDCWASKLVPEHWLLAWKGEEGNDTCCLVLRSGPYNVLLVNVKKLADGVLGLAECAHTMPFTALVTDLDQVRVASCQVTLHEGDDTQLGWAFSSEWMDIPNYLADYGLESLPAALLSKVCSRLKLSGHSKLDHQHRAEMFLRHMERPEQRIKEVLEFLALKKKEREKPEGDEEDADTERKEDEDEEEEWADEDCPEDSCELAELLEVTEEPMGDARPRDDAVQPMDADQPKDTEEDAEQPVDAKQPMDAEPEAAREEAMLRKAREDGPHQPRVERDVELGDLKLPPGVVAGLGFPERASPFVQARLPVGMKYEGKASRCVSFRSADCPFARGTRKTQSQACSTVSSWAWQWWETLSDIEKSAVKSAAKVSGSKRAADTKESQPCSSKKAKV